MRSARPLVLLALAAASGALAPPARANMASPVQPGTPAGEPAAALADLHVVRERLTIDLRPLAVRAWTVPIEVVYRIENRGARRRIPLEFLALGDGPDASQVWLDGAAVAAVPTDSMAVPEAWRAVTTTPALRGDPAPYESDEGLDRTAGLRFTLDLAPGAHEVRVRYAVFPGSYDGGDRPNRIWQLAYSLAPARQWAAFGTLDVEVLVPAGWEAAATLPLRRDDDRLVGRFEGVPADVLALSARAPDPFAAAVYGVAPFGAALLVCLIVGALGGLVVGATGRRAAWALPGALLAGVGAAATYLTAFAWLLEAGDSNAYGYGRMIGAILLIAPATVVVGTVLAQLVAAGVVRRQRATAGV